MRRPNIQGGASLLLAVSLVSSCGAQRPAVTASASKVLTADAAEVTAAARSGDPVRTQAALVRLGRDVQAQERAGQLQPGRASSILAAGARVAADVVGSRPSPAPAPSAPTWWPATRHGDGGDGGGD